ncbi:MAG: hypothetical protein M3008_00325 [Chloroflexota bacterium]|nr:hypothetical protein [Chloroflexota bacterium]
MSATQRRWTTALLLAIAAVAAIAFLPVAVPTADATISPAPASEDAGRAVGPLSGGRTATQEFPAGGTKIRSVALLLATYKRTNRGTAQITVQANTDGQWTNLATRAIDKENLRDNGFATITFSPPLAVVPGQPVRIILQSDGAAGAAIAWWSNTRWRPDGYVLTADGTGQDGTARFQVSYAPATGRLFRMLGPVWDRLTVFLDPFWRVVLALGFGFLIGGLVLAGRRIAG